MVSKIEFLSSTPAPVILPTDDSDSVQDHLDRLQKRLERAEFCMAKLITRDTGSGLMKQVSRPCKEWRVCPRCKKFRVKTYRGRIETALANDAPVRFILTDPDRAKKLTRKYTKEMTLKLPQEDETVAVFIGTEDEIGETLTVESAHRLPWGNLVYTPEGQKVTGFLGRSTGASGETRITIRQPAYAIDGLTDDQLAQADQHAIRATMNLDPQTPAELEDAIRKRNRVYLRQIKHLGGKVTFSRMLNTDIENHIRWKMTLPEMIRKVKVVNQPMRIRPMRSRTVREVPIQTNEQKFMERTERFR